MRPLLVVVPLLTCPLAAQADLDDPFTLALAVGGIRRSPETMREGSADAAFAARLKFFRGFGVDASYTLGAVDSPDPMEAQTVKELFPAPNVRVLGILEPFPNEYFSPYLHAGGGWATRSSLSVSTLLAGFGVQVGLGPHVAVALDAIVLLPWPDNATAFVRRNVAARAKGDPAAPVTMGDLLTVNRNEFQLTLRYYL